MKLNRFKSHFLLLAFIFITSVLFSQTNTSDGSLPDSVKSVSQENAEQKQKNDKKRKDEFKVFGGISFNQLSMESDLLKPTIASGWLLGASYKRGKFFYWQIGATYNNAIYNLVDTTLLPGLNLDGVFSVRSVDLPVTVGVNLLTFVSRIVGLRAYVSVIPAFAVGVADNKLNISMDHINSFNIYGQAGVGVDVAFLFVEAGYNYGFKDLFKNDIKSNPNQIFVNLGFRF